MKFLFKINSGYDGFTPARIPKRLDDQGRIRLGWATYIDSVEPLDEVWIWFKGPHKFANGVYVQGRVAEVNRDEGIVWLRPQRHATDRPLLGEDDTSALAQIVDVPFRQVFVMPEAIPLGADCDLATTATTCQAHHCSVCSSWQALPVIDSDENAIPVRLTGILDTFAPAYWVVPPRSFLYYAGGTVTAPIRRTTELFHRFKVGEEALAYPLALGIAEAIRSRRIDDLNAIVPIPLSPDKAASGELHRTELLATQLSGIIGVPVARVLSLSAPISKRRLRGDHGFSAPRFEAAYADLLGVHPARNYRTVLLLDDVCTEGSTLRTASVALRSVTERVIAATAGQMAVKAVVRHPGRLLT